MVITSRNKLLILGIILILFTSSALATDVDIYIFGTNKTNADSNATANGGNNTIEVQAWNTSYVKNFTVRVTNGSGDTIRFNISNTTANRVHEVLINGSSYNGYLSGANGMLNFTLNQTQGNKTYVIRPAQNLPPGNMSWVYQWRGQKPDNQTVQTGKTLATVYQNTGSHIRFVSVSAGRAAAINLTAYSSPQNPPNHLVSIWRSSVDGIYSANVFFIVLPNYYYSVQCPDLNCYTGTTYGDSWVEWS